jgi:hypothetical protein
MAKTRMVLAWALGSSSVDISHWLLLTCRMRWLHANHSAERIVQLLVHAAKLTRLRGQESQYGAKRQIS